MTGRNIQLYLSAGLAALALMGAGSAQAATTAGTTITNSATVDYQVEGIQQNQQSASTSIVVDRKINLTMAEVGSATTTVSPGQSGAVLTYSVTNTSNATLDFKLVAAQLSGTTAAHGGTDSFDVTGLAIYRDSNGNGTYDSGTDTAITYIDELAADASQTVFVVATIPLGLANGAVSGVVLTATAHEGGGSGSQGAAVTETTGSNTAGMDTVFADGAGATDTARSADFSAADDYTVLAPTLTITKTATVIDDPINGTTNPKLVPGATVQYCVAVANASGGATASNVAISDSLPAEVTYASSYGIKLNGTVSGGVCQTDGTSGGSYSAGTVSGTLASVAAGETRTLLFRATID